LENYREFLSTNEDSKGRKNLYYSIKSSFFLELSLKPAEDLLHELSFLSKKKLLTEVKTTNFNSFTNFLFFFSAIIFRI